MRTVVILMDTFRRDNLKIYNPDSKVQTPFIDAIANDSLIFDQHWIGSAPCMPARRDMFTGRLNFVERSWGPIEPFDVTLQKVLKEHGIFSHITTDHCHYFRLGGENYVQQFNTWDYIRGQEGDPYISRIDEPTLPESYYGRLRPQYQHNRTAWTKPEEYPSPKTFISGMNWIKDNKQHEDFFLMVECFDPHEPFDVPDDYMALYDKVEMDVEYYETPHYGKVDTPQEGVNYLKIRYSALTTMNDEFFGQFIQNLKDEGIYDETLIIITTDHGFVFGEHDFVGKNVMHLYNELAHLPLMVKFPHSKRAGERVGSLTQNIDIMPTILDAFNLKIPQDVKGKSWMPLLNNKDVDREAALYGYHGLAMNVTDGKHTYFRAPNEKNWPLYEYGTIPTTIREYLGAGIEDQIEMGHFIKRSKYPTFKIPAYKPQQIKDYEGGISLVSETKLFDIEADYHQNDNLANKGLAVEQDMIEKMQRSMMEHEAPLEQFQRLDLEIKEGE